MIETSWDILRVLNIIFAAAVGCWMFMLGKWYYKRWSDSNQDAFVGLGIWSFMGGYGAMENLLQDGQGGLRVALTTLALMYSIRWCSRCHREVEGNRAIQK